MRRVTVAMVGPAPVGVPVPGPEARARAGFVGAMGIGLLAALFFSVSFVLNRRMELGGGSWEWTASLRYLMVLPVLAAIVHVRAGVAPVVAALRARPVAWLV